MIFSNIYKITTIVFLIFSGCSSIKVGHKQEERDSKKIANIEIPAPLTEEEIVHHTAYTLSYNKVYKQANWVAYILTANETKSLVKRSNKFTTDPQIKNTASDIDYKKSGYDRGHLAPAGDMEWTDIAMKESFYYSNMSPQVPAFNRGIWEELEEQVRVWAVEYDSVYVVTGPVLSNGLKTIGPNKVVVPNYFYKALLIYSNNNFNAIGVIIPNKGSKENIQSFIVSIDSVEAVTHLDFFSALPNDIENKIEATINLSSWNWNQENK